MKGIDNSTPIGQLPVLLLQFLVLSRNQSCLLDLIDLKFQERHFPVLLLFVHIKGFQLRLTFLIFLIGCFHLFFFRKNSLTAIGIQDFQLLLFIEKGLMLMLSMNIKKAGCCSFHLTHSTCLPIYFVNAPAVHNFSGHEDLSVFRVNVKCGKCLFCLCIFYLE